MIRASSTAKEHPALHVATLPARLQIGAGWLPAGGAGQVMSIPRPLERTHAARLGRARCLMWLFCVAECCMLRTVCCALPCWIAHLQRINSTMRSCPCVREDVCCGASQGTRGRCCPRKPIHRCASSGACRAGTAANWSLRRGHRCRSRRSAYDAPAIAPAAGVGFIRPLLAADLLRRFTSHCARMRRKGFAKLFIFLRAGLARSARRWADRECRRVLGDVSMAPALVPIAWQPRGQRLCSTLTCARATSKEAWAHRCGLRYRSKCIAG